MHDTTTAAGTSNPRFVEDSAPASHEAVETVWPQWRRIGFRFLAAYFLLYTLPFPLSGSPWVADYVWRAVLWLWESPTMWFGRHVVGIDDEIFRGPTGSGDTTFAFLKLLLMVTLAIVITLIWSVLDRRRTAYPRAARWLVVGCSFFLGSVLLSYGQVKIIPTQFGTPSLERLLTTYGESSPMGLAWTFLGFSPAYQIFAGLMEAIPAILLFFRRTRLLGAVLAVAVLTNVVLINFCFDVPVKLLSSHLLAMAIALVLVDVRRLVAFFVGDRAVAAPESAPLFASRRWNIAAVVVGVLLIAPSAITEFVQGLGDWKTFGPDRPKSELHGVYDIESFSVDGEALPALLTDTVRWRALVVDRALPISSRGFTRSGRIAIQSMDGSIERRNVDLDESTKTLRFIPEDYRTAEEVPEDAWVEMLRYDRSEPDRLTMSGTLDGKAVEITLVPRATDELLLISRGFNWINERPLNR